MGDATDTSSSVGANESYTTIATGVNQRNTEVTIPVESNVCYATTTAGFSLRSTVATSPVGYNTPSMCAEESIEQEPSYEYDYILY